MSGACLITAILAFVLGYVLGREEADDGPELQDRVPPPRPEGSPPPSRPLR